MRIDTLSLMLSSKKEKSPILSCCKLTTRGCHTYLHYRGSNEPRWGQDPPVLGTELMHGATKLSLLPPRGGGKHQGLLKKPVAEPGLPRPAQGVHQHAEQPSWFVHESWFGQLQGEREKGGRGGDFQNSIPALARTGCCSYVLHCHPSSAFWLRRRNLSALALFDSRYYRCCHGNDLCKN